MPTPWCYHPYYPQVRCSLDEEWPCYHAVAYVVQDGDKYYVRCADESRGCHPHCECQDNTPTDLAEMASWGVNLGEYFYYPCQQKKGFPPTIAAIVTGIIVFAAKLFLDRAALSPQKIGEAVVYAVITFLVVWAILYLVLKRSKRR